MKFIGHTMATPESTVIESMKIFADRRHWREKIRRFHSFMFDGTGIN